MLVLTSGAVVKCNQIQDQAGGLILLRLFGSVNQRQ